MTAPAPLPPPDARDRARPTRGARPAPLRVVPPPEEPARPVRAYVRRLVVTATAVGALCLFGVVVAHVQLTQNQFRLAQLRQAAATQQAEYDRLRLEVARLESPGRIVSEAQQRLGMIVPESVVYLAPSPEDQSVEASTLARAGDDGDNPARATGAGTGADRAAPAGRPGSAGWSTVKPHLAER